MSAWGGFHRRVHGVLGGWMVSGIAYAMLGVASGLPGWMLFMAFSMMLIPLIDASNQAIWQTKVSPDIQGRVFSARRIIAWFSQPIAPIIAGLLADFVLEPAMTSSTWLAKIFGPVFSTSPGSGMSLLLFFMGFFVAITGLSGYFIRPIRDAEDILPDHTQDNLTATQPELAAP
jgi:hypothetical protein